MHLDWSSDYNNNSNYYYNIKSYIFSIKNGLSVYSYNTAHKIRI